MRDVKFEKVENNTKEAFELASEVQGTVNKYGKYIWDEEKQEIRFIDNED